MNFFLSTPGRYVDALKKERHVKWPLVKDRDFFPYAESHLMYWTGYYSSRPGFKK
jgi:hypothetical protein